jgi:hypothetical protein
MDRFTWGIVGGALLLVVLGVASVSVLRRPPAPPDLSRPDGVVRAYVAAMAADHPEDAWDLLAESARVNVTRDEFIRRATQDTTSRNDAGRLSIDKVEINGTTAVVEINRTYTSGGGLLGPSTYSTRSTVRLERFGSSWRITVPPEPWLIDKRPG